MLNGQAIAREIRDRAAADSDSILRHAVERIHEDGAHCDWVGIYLLKDDELVLHNFIGKPTEHTRIAVGRGVCGTAVAEGRDINVPDVTALDNYLACSTETRSEIVVLIRTGERILGQIDIDSDQPAAFDEEDERQLKRIADALADVLAEKPGAEDPSGEVQ